jgi:hypothetical protein
LKRTTKCKCFDFYINSCVNFCSYCIYPRLPAVTCGYLRLRQLLLMLSMFSTWVLLPTTLTLLPLPTLLPTLLFQEHSLKLLYRFYVNYKFVSMIFMSNFSHKIFQSGLSLPLSESHNNSIGNDDVIVFMFVSKLNATVFKMCEETEDRLVIYVACFACQMLRQSDASLVRYFARQMQRFSHDANEE